VTKKTKKTPEKESSRSGKNRRLSTKDLKFFQEKLLEKRIEILSDVDEIEDETLRKSRLDATGDLSNMPIHMADIGTDNYEQEFALGLMDSERKILSEIHEALQRIQDGTYGICEGMGKPIQKTRLKAQPWTRYCIEYARKLENGEITEEE